MDVNQKKRWGIAPQITPQADIELGAFSTVLKQILFNRGYATDKEARAYLKGEILNPASPFMLSGMQAAVDRIDAAIKKQEAITIYGDYDVDGVTATVLLVESIRAFGGHVIGFIPNRFEEGYGLNNDALDILKEKGNSLVITVDCGIRSPAEARYASEIGLDLIITDHHQPAPGDLPSAAAVLNPKQDGDLYPDKDLAGVGVAYKLAQALVETHSSEPVDFDLESILDLVALGTVADLAPLVGENRSLVRKGITRIRESRRQGLFSLAAVSDLSLASVTASSIGFILGPRLNAAGRIESALAAYDLLLTKDVKTAGEKAQLLNSQNRQRQELTRKIQKAAEELAISSDPGAELLFAVHPEFNAGVVGLAASRLTEAYYRPAVVGQVMEETTRCSCRSIPEFHITMALDECADLLIRHGGHAAAAGFTVRNQNLKELEERLKRIARTQLGNRDLRKTLMADIEVPITSLTGDLLKNLNFLQPTGYGNPEAVFITRNLAVASSRTVGTDSKHLKLIVTDGRITFDAIGFNLGNMKTDLPNMIDIIYTFETNEYNGRTSLQLNIKDIQPA